MKKVITIISRVLYLAAWIVVSIVVYESSLFALYLCGINIGATLQLLLNDILNLKER